MVAFRDTREYKPGSDLLYAGASQLAAKLKQMAACHSGRVSTPAAMGPCRALLYD
jgi:hypothetical protein